MRNVRLMLLAIGLVATLSAADPFVGVWKLNMAKSNFQSGPAPRQQITTITEADGQTRIKIDGIAADGTPTLVDYRIPTNGGMGTMQKSKAYDGVSAKMLGPGEREIDRLKDGRVVYTVVGKVSADGKSITTVSKGLNPLGQPVENTGVYDRIK
jgi:hypothetical protein